MKRFVIATCAVIGGAFAYAACDWGQWRRLTYLPITHELVWHAPAGAVAIVYPGTVLWGLGGAITGALVGVVLAGRPWSARVLQLFGGWAIAAIVLAGAYYTWSLWPW